MTDSPRVERWTIAEAAEATGWRHHGDGEVALGPLAIDSRSLEAGTAFAAIASRDGMRHGAAHWADARDRGACAVLFGTDAAPSAVADAIGAGMPVLVADVDGWRALGTLARAWRRRCGFTVVGITGSSGKTSTKDLLAALLERRVRVMASMANRNNELGVPLTILDAPPGTDVVICEMGMRARGEIAWLCEVAEPDIGILTVAGSAHLELLGSIDAIAAAKAEIISGVRPDGVAIIPDWQPHLEGLAARLPERIVRFGEQQHADARILEVRRTDRGIAGIIAAAGRKHPFDLPVRGVHQSRNLAAAIAAAIEIIGVSSLDLTLEQVAMSAGRGDWHLLADGTLVIDDAYNANPESMAAALSELAAVDVHARRVAVLGYMAELGLSEDDLHAQLGARAARHPEIDQLVVVATRPAVREVERAWNELRPDAAALAYHTAADALEHVDDWLRAGDAVLVKASNAAGLGRIAAGLVESGGVPPVAGRSAGR